MNHLFESKPDDINSPVGRFAPSPTGKLHFGSLVAAVASFLQVKHHHGHWLIRIEDIDPPREVAGSSQQILGSLARFGMQHDGPVLYQSQRTEHYCELVEKLLQQGKAYWCGCSRRDLPRSGIYPGTCRNGLAAGKKPRAVRLKVDTTCIRFIDLIQGSISAQLEKTVGDFVIQRADRLPAYQLAVVVDDAFQGVTEVVRGADLLDSCARQIYLQRCLGLPTPSFAHHPVAVDSQGHKLSKRFGSDPLNTLSAEATIIQALRFLGQSPPADLDLDSLWPWAIENWRLSAVPRMTHLPSPILGQNERSFPS